MFTPVYINDDNFTISSRLASCKTTLHSFHTPEHSPNRKARYVGRHGGACPGVWVGVLASVWWSGVGSYVRQAFPKLLDAPGSTVDPVPTRGRVFVSRPFLGLGKLPSGCSPPLLSARVCVWAHPAATCSSATDADARRGAMRLSHGPARRPSPLLQVRRAPMTRARRSARRSSRPRPHAVSRTVRPQHALWRGPRHGSTSRPTNPHRAGRLPLPRTGHSTGQPTNRPRPGRLAASVRAWVAVCIPPGWCASPRHTLGHSVCTSVRGSPHIQGPRGASKLCFIETKTNCCADANLA